jgi:hypothetical protein
LTITETVSEEPLTQQLFLLALSDNFDFHWFVVHHLPQVLVGNSSSPTVEGKRERMPISGQVNLG